MSPGGFSSFHTTFEFSVASANATNETALRAAVLAILAAEDLDVNSAAVSVTYNVTTTRRRLRVRLGEPSRFLTLVETLLQGGPATAQQLASIPQRCLDRLFICEHAKLSFRKNVPGVRQALRPSVRRR